MTRGMIVDEIVWDEDVESVTNDITYSNAPMIMIRKNNSTFFINHPLFFTFPTRFWHTWLKA